MASLCLFGGSFDPVHLGHLLVAQAALEELGLDRIFFIPAAQSPFKTHTQITAGPARLQMLRTALAGKPWAEVDEHELTRGGVSFTIDTVRSYRNRFPGAKLHYLIGQDNLNQLPEWRESTELARLTDFVVIPRPPVSPAGPAPEASANIPEGFRIRFLQGFPAAIASSQIRSRVREHLSVTNLLPAGVEEIIRNNRLYL